MRKKTIDEDYLEWIRKLPCCICGYIPSGETPSGKPRSNAAHHVHGRSNDHMVVPLCDWWKDMGATKRLGYCCHHGRVHRNMKTYKDKLVRMAKEYRRVYELGR